MSIVDSFYKLSGKAKKDKQVKLQEVGRSLSTLEDWIGQQDDEDIEALGFAEIFEVLAIGNKILIRLINKLDITYSEEVMDDCLQLGRSILILKYVIAVELGFDFEPKKRYSLPLVALSHEDENGLVAIGTEALELTRSLGNKYSY